MKGFDKEDFLAPIADINTTPLVDVMLVLMVIFLVTAPILTQSIKLELPNEPAENILDDKSINISISENGVYYWDKEEINEDELEKRLQLKANKDKEQAINLHADVKTPYGKVSKVLAMSQKYGLTNIGFITDPN